jgi:hypothetical protein
MIAVYLHIATLQCSLSMTRLMEGLIAGMIDWFRDQNG